MEGRLAMTIIGQINELINRGIVGLVLAVVGLMLLYYLFGREAQSPSKKTS
jgi:hypothetical protein